MDEDNTNSKGSAGGRATLNIYGREFFSKIGKLGGARTKRLVEVGKRALKKQKKR
jgi:hypothetical protein